LRAVFSGLHLLAARWWERDPQVLRVPTPQRFPIFGSEEESSDSGHLFYFPFLGANQLRAASKIPVDNAAQLSYCHMTERRA
jgi:hypothetical protein